MQLFNSASRAVERFRPRSGEAVTLYVCGITPYDTTHLGHAFTYVVFDTLVRHMRVVHGWPVRYVQNLTDIDDDILKRARETDSDWRDLGLEWTRRFTDDMARLNVGPPDGFPGATAFIGPMQEYIGELIASGLAYESGGSVYFRVDADPEFGELTGLSPTEMLEQANERGNHPDDPAKQDPLDFVLWQAAKEGEPAWHSPWGPGRPGWHIECSTMALRLLGNRLDIHGGGADLWFPHHTCCISQSEPVISASPWVSCWMHTAMVRMDGAKMSKSLGNLVLAHQLLEDHHPDTVRLYLLRHHYREPWEWDEEELRATKSWTRTLHAAVAREPGSGPLIDPTSYGPRFTAAMDDDLNTPDALAIAMQLADEILAAPSDANVAAARDLLSTIAGGVLGLWLRDMEEVPEVDRQAAQWPEPDIAPPDGTYPLSE